MKILKFIFILVFALLLFRISPAVYGQDCNLCYEVPLLEPCNTGDVVQSAPAPDVGYKLCGPAQSANDSGGAPKIGTVSPSQVNPVSVQSLIGNSVNVLIAIAGLVFFFMLIFGGFRYLISNGDEKAAATARGTLTNAFIGLVIVVAAFLIAQLIFYLFKIPGVILKTP